jgi:hypothetical protein
MDFFESGDQVVVAVNNRLRPKGGTAGEFAYRNASVFTIRNGTVVSVVGYPTPEDGPRKRRESPMSSSMVNFIAIFVRRSGATSLKPC